MKYLIAGAGGTGGLIGGFLAGRAGADVTLLARGAHLEAIRAGGLVLKMPQGTQTVKKLRAVPAEALNNEIFDVIFVCVKAYSLQEISSLLHRVSNSDTLIIPILNAMEAGNVLRQALPDRTVADGCIYITGYISAPGEITQNNSIFKIVYGFSGQEKKQFPGLPEMEAELHQSGIETLYSTDIFNELFKKLSFTSAFAAVGAYHGLKADDIQHTPRYRQAFIDLLTELQAIQQAAFQKSSDLVRDNVTILDQLSGEFTASLQKDLAADKPDEREQLIFDVVRLARKYQVEVPGYTRIARFFGFKEVMGGVKKY